MICMLYSFEEANIANKRIKRIEEDERTCLQAWANSTSSIDNWMKNKMKKKNRKEQQQYQQLR